jgi:hypothetical protein
MRKFFALLILAILLSGCYGGVKVISRFGRNATYSPDSTKIVFFKFIQVYKSAKGLWSLPDGGMPKVLYRNVSVYCLNTKTNELTRIFDYTGISSNRDSWKTKTFYTDTSIIFNIEPTIGWKSELKYRTADVDTLMHKRNMYWFSYNHNTKKVVTIPPPEQELPFWPISFDDLREHTNHFTLNDWGVDVLAVYPQSKRQMLNEISRMKHSAVFSIEMIDQLAPKLTERDIRRTIRRLDRYLDKQSDYQRSMMLGKRNAIVDKLLEVKQDLQQNNEE